MAHQSLDPLVEDVFVELCHLRILRLQLLITPLKEAKSVSQLALRYVFHK